MTLQFTIRVVRSLLWKGPNRTPGETNIYTRVIPTRLLGLFSTLTPITKYSGSKNFVVKSTNLHFQPTLLSSFYSDLSTPTTSNQKLHLPDLLTGTKVCRLKEQLVTQPIIGGSILAPSLSDRLYPVRKSVGPHRTELTSESFVLLTSLTPPPHSTLTPELSSVVTGGPPEKTPSNCPDLHEDSSGRPTPCPYIFSGLYRKNLIHTEN